MRAPWILAVTLAGCVSSPPRVATAGPEMPPLPALVVTTGETAFETPGPKPVRVATPRKGLPLSVREQDESGKLLAQLTGAVEVSGAVRLEALAVMVCEPGPLGDQLYVGDRNLLWLRSGVQGGKVRVAAEVLVRARPYDPAKPGARQVDRVLLEELAIDVRRLCPRLPKPRHAGTEDDPQIIHGDGYVDPEDFPQGTPIIDVEANAPLTLHRTPGGEVVRVLPPSGWRYPVMRIRREGGWDQIATGSGPYLLGWIPAREPRQPEPPGSVGGLGLSGSARMVGPWSLHTKEVKDWPLHELPAGAEIQQFGQVHARFKAKGWARVGRLENGWRFVVAAVDHDVVVRGWIDPAKLGERVDGQ